MKQLSPKQLKFITNAFQEGNKSLQLGLLSKAEQLFSEVLRVDPNIPEARAALAYVLSSTKQYSKANLHLKALLKLHPNHAQTHYNIANNCYSQQDYSNAIEHYKSAIKLAPNFVEAYINCAIAFRMMSNHTDSISYLRMALDIDKTNSRAFYILGMVYDDIDDLGRALECLESAVGLAPNEPEFIVSFANVLQRAKLDYEAGVMFHKACEVNPNYFDSFKNYAEFLLKAHRYDEAIECLMHARNLQSQDLSIHDMLGQAYSGMNNSELAVSTYQDILMKEPSRLSSLTGLAQVYLDIGDIPKLTELCNKIIDINPEEPNGYLIKARINKYKENNDLVSHLTKFTINNDLDDEQRLLAYFALGKVLDDSKNYKEAFEAYASGNAIKNKTLNYNKSSFENSISNIISFFNADKIVEKVSLGSSSNLPVLIVGMPRSGTTLTEQIISSHPEIIGAGEVPFWGKSPTAIPYRINSKTPFPDCIDEISSNAASAIAEMYESTLHKIVGQDTKPKHITDKMPHNFLFLGLIAIFFPNVKIIHTKRDPIDTCLSIFFQNFNNAHQYAADLTNLVHQYKQYERLMLHWHKLFPNRILDINYENMIADPEYWSRKLIQHVGVNWDDACLAPHKLERSVKTASHWQVRQPIYKSSVERWKNYEPYIDTLVNAFKSE